MGITDTLHYWITMYLILVRMVYLVNHLDDENRYNNIPYSYGHFYRWGINQVVEHSPDRLFTMMRRGPIV